MEILLRSTRGAVLRSVLRRGVAGRLLRNEFIRHGALVFASSQFVNILNYGFHFVLTRKLGVSGYGEMASLVNGLTVISFPSAILMLIVVKFAAELHAADDANRLRTLSERVLFGSCIGAVALFVAGIIFSPLAARFLHLASTLAVIVTCAIFAITLIMPGARGILQGGQDFWRLRISTGLEGLLKVGLGLSFVAAGYGVVGALGGWLLGSTIGLLYTIVAVRLHWGPLRVPLYIDFRRVLYASGGIAVATMVSGLMASMDVPLVKHFFSPTTAGLYSGGVALSGKILFFIVGFVATLVLPKATSAAVRGGNPLPVLFQGAAMMLSLSAGGLVIFYLFPATVVGVLAGHAYVAAAPYIFPYGLAMSFLAAASLAITYKIGLHRFDFVAPIIFVMLSEIVAINVWHRSIQDVVNILLVGNCIAFIVSLYRVNAPTLVYAVGQGSEVA